MDMLIVGIFLGMINLLFLTFITTQIPFLFSKDYLPENMSLANFAREGFFQLMMVMAIVILIFFFLMRRFKGEKLTIFFLSTLLIQTMIMGIVSLKKMYLYQEIKGATVLRYYVEWFDYFLLFVLALGVLFLVRRLNFARLLDFVSVVALASFLLVISLNVDAMVAKHNIEKFQESPEKLDRNALAQLSIDALPIIKSSGVKPLDRYSLDGVMSPHWYEERKREKCKSFAVYHYGYCSKLKEYGVSE